MTLIVIEGVDGSGKSTLVEALGHDTVIHCGPLTAPPLTEYVDALDWYDGTTDVVCDRWHIGELVYGPLYRSRSKLTEAMRRYVEMFLDSRGAVKVILDAPLPEIQRRLEHRGEDFLRPQDLHKVWMFYRLYGSDHGWQVLDRPDVDALASMAITSAALVHDVLTLAPSYIGGHRPDILFATVAHGALPLRPEPGSAGELFFDSLPDGIRCGVMNIGELNYTVWEALGFPKVVVVGTAIHYDVVNVPMHNRIPHPHAILRQTPKRAAEYGRMITLGVSRG